MALFTASRDPRYGQAAFTGGSRMIAMGVLFHYVIAFCWVACYFTLYPLISTQNTGMLVDAAVYGLIVWSVMNLVVLPLSKAARRPSSFSFILINMVILMVAIGLPCAYAARHAR